MGDPQFHFASERSFFPEQITTDRLLLEQLSSDAIGALDLYEYLGKGETIEAETRHLDWGPHDTPRVTKHLLAQVEQEWQEAERAVYVVRPSAESEDGDDQAFAGIATLSIEWDRRVGELGVFLRKPYWGRGYSSERAGALLALAFEHLDLEVVEMTCSVANERAKRSIEKYVAEYGGEYVGRRYNANTDETGEPFDSHLFAITRDQYRQ